MGDAIAVAATVLSIGFGVASGIFRVLWGHTLF